MKKTILGIFFFFLLTLKVHAVDISSTNISGDKKKKIGEEGSFNFTINFSDLEKGYDKTLGIWTVAIAIKADDDAIKLTSVSANDFVSIFTYDSNEKVYYIISEVSDDATASNLCAEGNLYCSNYAVKVNYIIKDTSKKSANVNISDIEVALLDMIEDREYTLDDAISIEKSNVAKYTVAINSNKNTNTSQTVSKSENKSLKSLEIEGVDFEFDKQKTDYTISVAQGVNKLNIKATPEDKNATYKVIGADNLTASKSIVRVEVTAQDKTKQTYYIRVRYDKGDSNQVTNETSDLKKDDSEETETSNKKEKVNGDIIKWLGIGAGVFVGIGLVAFIISKIKDRSIDKKLSSLDDD